MIKVERTEKPKSLQKNEAKWVKKIQEALDLIARATTDAEKQKDNTVLNSSIT